MDPSQTAHERRAQIAWLLSSLERQPHDGSGLWSRHVARKKGCSLKGKGKGTGKTPQPMFFVPRSALGPRLSFTPWCHRQACCFAWQRTQEFLRFFFDRHIWKETRVTTLEPRCAGKEICVDASLNLTHPVKPLRFSFANGEEDVSTSVPLVSYLPWRVISLSSCTQRARTCVVGS